MATIGLLVLANVYLLRRVMGPVQALTVLARRVDLTSAGQRITRAEPTSEAGELALTFNEMPLLEAERTTRPAGCLPRRKPSGCGSLKSSTTRSASS